MVSWEGVVAKPPLPFEECPRGCSFTGVQAGGLLGTLSYHTVLHGRRERRKQVPGSDREPWAAEEKKLPQDWAALPEFLRAKMCVSQTTKRWKSQAAAIFSSGREHNLGTEGPPTVRYGAEWVLIKPRAPWEEGHPDGQEALPTSEGP